MQRVIATIAMALTTLVIASPHVDGADRPNVILIMADDLGYETLSCNGGTTYSTPNLDAMAADGMRFTHCFAQPLCTPTRVQLMTGQSNKRNYIRFGLLPPESTTFGNLFEKAGYATAIVGKWQLGNTAGLPQQFGFQESYLWQQTRRPPRYANPGLEMQGIEKDFENGEYGPELLNQEACKFIERNKAKPFFLYYPMVLTHSPYQPTPDSPKWDKTAKGEKVNQNVIHFIDMVAYMDKMIGRLRKTVTEAGIADNTLILFLGDNGTGRGVVSMMGEQQVVGGKGMTNRFGMHVPMVAVWPRKIPANSSSNELVDSTDFFPTICDAASITIPQHMIMDGFSFLPQLQGQTAGRRSWIYSWYSPRQQNDKVFEFAFDENYKLYDDGRIFDIQNDPAEKAPLIRNELSPQAAETITKLEAVLQEYAQIVPQPSGL